MNISSEAKNIHILCEPQAVFAGFAAQKAQTNTDLCVNTGFLVFSAVKLPDYISKDFLKKIKNNVKCIDKLIFL